MLILLVLLMVLTRLQNGQKFILPKTLVQNQLSKFAGKFFLPLGYPNILYLTMVVISFKLKRFLQENGITAKLTASYHPATNGQAERYVQTLKKALRTMKCDNYSKNLELCKFLLQYRRTPHIITGKSPSELMFGRQIRSRLDCMTPEINGDHVTYNTGKQIRELELGTRVANWEITHYTIELDDGRRWKRYINKIRPIGQETPTEPYLPEHDSTNRTTNTFDIRHESQNVPDIPTLNTNPNIASSTSLNNTELSETEPLQTPEDEPGQPNIEDVPPVIRRYTRVRKAPIRLDFSGGFRWGARGARAPPPRLYGSILYLYKYQTLKGSNLFKIIMFRTFVLFF
nr:unnamed protein product [Callosobruchus analis]